MNDMDMTTGTEEEVMTPAAEGEEGTEDMAAGAEGTEEGTEEDATDAE